MKPFEGFPSTSQQVIFAAVPDDGAFHTVTLTGLDPDAKLVSIRVLPFGPPGVVGVKPVGATEPNAVYQWNMASAVAYATTIQKVVSGQMQFSRSAGSVAAFVVTGQWGGDAVKLVSGNTMLEATGYVGSVNGGQYRELDLGDFPTQVDPADLGNIEAAICMLRSAGIECDARAVGSTWNKVWPVGIGRRTDTVVKVSDGNTIEVVENGNLIGKGPDKTRDSYVYVLGYILRDAVQDGGGRDVYQYKAVLDPADDGVGSTGPVAWTSYDVTARTSSSVDSIYWRLSNRSTTVDAALFAREVGDTAGGTSQLKGRRVGSFPLKVDGSRQVQHWIDSSKETESWIFGYQEFLGQLPLKATDPVPASGASGEVGTELAWTAGDAATSHDVYFGTSPVLGLGDFQGNQAGTAFSAGELVPGALYYWRVDEVNGLGTTVGDVWSFTYLSPCDWAASAAAAGWKADKAAPDWAASAAAAGWKADKAAPDWAATASGGGWFGPQGCD